MDQESKQQYGELLLSIKQNLKTYKERAEKDLIIDELDLDESVLKTPRIMSKYNDYFTTETLVLKDLYQIKKRIELERWKYYSGKQSDQYYSKNGIVHEKILKGDIDKYLGADEKMNLIDSIIAQQKAVVDYLERAIKEIQSRNFHCKVAVDWRKFTAGV